MGKLLEARDFEISGSSGIVRLIATARRLDFRLKRCHTGSVTFRPDSITAAVDAVMASPALVISGAGTKPGLYRAVEREAWSVRSGAGEGVANRTSPATEDGRREGQPPVRRLEMSALRGIAAYDPSEFTITALAGTSLTEVSAALAEHGQYLPFDPPLAGAGATLGGSVAAAMSGAGRLRYGGVRDFIIGLQWIDGEGRLLHGGGKVVKNAAGFDFPKLFCGSLGRLGVITECTFKVFPSPMARATIEIECRDLPDAIERMTYACAQPWEVEAAECGAGSQPPHGDGDSDGRRCRHVYLRFMGNEPALTVRVESILAALQRPGRLLPAGESGALWKRLASLDFAGAEFNLAKVSLTPARIMALEAAVSGTGGTCHYSMAGNAAWIAGLLPDVLDGLLRSVNLSGLLLRGDGPARMGIRPSAVMEEKVKAALDPHGRFPPL